MSEMIEKMVEALSAVPVMEGTYAVTGDDARSLAKAALQALLEPTSAMKREGAIAQCQASDRGGSTREADLIFKAMIQSALTD